MPADQAVLFSFMGGRRQTAFSGAHLDDDTDVNNFFDALYGGSQYPTEAGLNMCDGAYIVRRFCTDRITPNYAKEPLSVILRDIKDTVKDRVWIIHAGKCPLYICPLRVNFQ